MSTDIYLTADGDLDLGQQATNEDGFLLYYVQNEGGGIPDTTIDPDEGVTAVRDIKLVHGSERDLQLIRARLMTENPDWSLYPTIGADLTDLIGLPNIPSTAQEAIFLVNRALTQDGAFLPEELEIEVVPVGPRSLLLDIQLHRHQTLLRYAGTMDLALGVWNEYEFRED